jgi:hypothetical protein
MGEASAVERSGNWICCQLGARDHYSIPRSLYRRGLLEGLITEAWVPPDSALAKLPGELGERLRQRYDEGLAGANVLHCSGAFAWFEMRGSLTKPHNGWDSIIARNNWFQSLAARHLKALERCADNQASRAVFAYSYAAREILQTSRELGCTAILGQIDPGPAEERLVIEVCRGRGQQMADWQRAPAAYWEAWREECDLCDGIVVNSPWSRKALVGEGIPNEKIHVIPVAYDPPDDAVQFRRTYPKSFSAARPLRVLFLGSLIPRKGIHEMLEATSLLRNAPVEFWFVGGNRLQWPIQAKENRAIRWTGAVDRKRVHCFYRDADIFILPTHSDGFGQTQLEAMAWGLPVIASNNCGEVVSHGVNGLVLRCVTAEAIAEAIERCMDAEALERMSQSASQTCAEFRSDRLILQLLLCARKSLQPLASSSERRDPPKNPSRE